MKVLAVATGKGGSGKTSLSMHLAVGLAKRGKRVLLADLDPQGHATAWVLGFAQPPAAGTAEALLDGKLRPEHARRVTEEGLAGEKGGSLDLLPATPRLATADMTLAPEVGSHGILRLVLDAAAERWDYAILDTPGALGFYTLAALCAADGIVAPVPAAFLALSGLRQLEERIALARSRLPNVEARLLGYVMFATDPRKGITEECREILRRDAGDALFRAEVRVSTAAEALPARRLTAWTDGADPRGAEDYREVLAETLHRLDAGAARRKRGA